MSAESENVIVEYVELEDFLAEQRGATATAAAAAADDAAVSTAQVQQQEQRANAGEEDEEPSSRADFSAAAAESTSRLFPYPPIQETPGQHSNEAAEGTAGVEAKAELGSPGQLQQQRQVMLQEHECNSNLEALAQAAAAAAEKIDPASDSYHTQSSRSPATGGSSSGGSTSSGSGGGGGGGGGGKRRRRPRRPIPEEKKDDRYWKRRMKNNMAAQRSREAKRDKENKMTVKAAVLEREHQVLVSEVERARDVNRELRERLSKYEEC